MGDGVEHVMTEAERLEAEEAELERQIQAAHGFKLLNHACRRWRLSVARLEMFRYKKL